MTNAVTPLAAAPAGAATASAPKGHPKGLYILFFTEMWERMSYYGMRSLLVLYMVQYLFIQPEVGKQVLGFNLVRGTLEGIFGHLDIQPLSSQIYGLYTGFVYFTPFFGGILADRVLGQRKSVVVGAILMAIGHFLMAFESLFFLALLFLIVGNGAFKPNISTQVGLLYDENDPRRDRAFNIFYMGINLGAFLSPLVCGTLGQKVGWHWGFGAAGVGMLAGLVIYLWGQKYLAQDNLTQKRAQAAKAKQTKEPITREEWGRIIALVILCTLNIVFWGVYEQQGNTMQLWADQNVAWPTIFGFQVPSTWFQAFNPLMIFLFIPLINMVWMAQARRGKEPSSVTKMAVGCVILGLSFIVLILAVQGIHGGQKASMLWLVFGVGTLTLGEIYLSPVGLSLVTKVAPARMVSMLMGMWFLSSFFGNYLSGYLGTYYSTWSNERFFFILTVLGVGAGIAIFAINKPLRRIMGKHANA